ncbi:MAG: hypothetical protein J5802_04910 [Butyrivibrio sp.]|nr:hypothetical protein [Butyrivibrio sp.]
MFRKMRRFNQQITDEECIEVLRNTKRGVLSLMGDEGYPYGVPHDGKESQRGVIKKNEVLCGF